MDKSKSAADMFNKMAKLYEAKYMDVNSYAESLNQFCEHLNRADANILELACGPGNITKYLLDRHPSYKILGTDLAPKMIELAKVNCPTASFEILDCRQISKLNRVFDAVIVGFCLPYLEKEDVLDLIRSVRNLLGPGGLFYLSTMEGEYSTSRIQKSSSGDEVFVHYYDSKFLKESLISEDFEILNTWFQPDPTQQHETTDIVILAKK